MTAWQTRAITGSEAAILFHPDQRTPWAPSLVVHLAAGALSAEDAAARLAALAERHPIVDATFDRAGARWIAGSGRLRLEASADLEAILQTRFDLRAGPPLRVGLSAAGDRLVVVSHHAALDGRALLMVARALLGAEPIEAVGPAPRVRDAPGGASVGTGAGGGAGGAGAVGRMLRPADRVAPSIHDVRREAFVATDVPAGASMRVAALAAAAVDAAATWNAARGAAWGRVGLTIPVGGPADVGNVSTHRRLDLDLPADVASAVEAALAQAVAPPDAVVTPRRARVLPLLAPLVARLSDSLLVSNLGLVDLPGASAVDFFPQSRGRSAVAIGACTPLGGTPRITVRARDLGRDDAEALLGEVCAALVSRR